MITFENGLISLENKKGDFSYRTTKPKEVWGNYFCKIAFYEFNQKIYFNSALYCHALGPYDFNNFKVDFVKWSPRNNEVIIYEYKRNAVYNLKLLKLNTRESLTLTIKTVSNKKINEIIRHFTEHGLSNYDLIKIGFVPSSWINNKLGFFKRFYGK